MPNPNPSSENPPAGAPPHFLVIVPGFMGSRLRDRATGRLAWVDFTAVPLNPLEWGGWLDHLFETMTYPNDNLEPAGIVEDVLFVPPWAKQEQYSRLLRALENMGYHADPSRYAEPDLDVYTFPYDWRQDNRISGRQLGAAIARWSAFHPGASPWLMAHSNGGLVARWYIEQEGGKNHVGRLFLLASPWDGAVKSVLMLQTGLELLFRRGFDPLGIARRTRALLRTFPSIYQLIPHHDPFLRDQNNQPVDPYRGEQWLDDDHQRELLADAQRFNAELGSALSVDTICFFGRRVMTTTYGTVPFQTENRWGPIEWHTTEAGDGTLSLRTAVNPNARESLPFVAGHGDIYVNPALLEILQWELAGKYQLGDRAALATERLTIVFEPDRDVHAPGDTIGLWATLANNADPLKGVYDRSPVSGASITVRAIWRAPLPGAPAAAPQDLPPIGDLQPATQLSESDTTPGRYEGALVAPATEGYYQLHAVVNVVGESGIRLDEMILVEAAPAPPLQP